MKSLEEIKDILIDAGYEVDADEPSPGMIRFSVNNNIKDGTVTTNWRIGTSCILLHEGGCCGTKPGMDPNTIEKQAILDKGEIGRLF